MQDSISKTSKENFGKSAAFAFSGAAAGIIKGFTLHHGFSFSVTLNKRVRNGEIPLPELTESARSKLLDSWSSVKFIIVDEVYMLKVEWLSLIDEKLRQIFNSNIPFAGIPILLSGDPRQIVPVDGKPIFIIQKYFKFDQGEWKLFGIGADSLS